MRFAYAAMALASFMALILAASAAEFHSDFWRYLTVFVYTVTFMGWSLLTYFTAPR